LKLGENHPGPIHLLLTDVVMPGVTGKELASRLSALRKETKCLYLSGYTALYDSHSVIAAFLPACAAGVVELRALAAW
jgi:response regulator RpfG family c-di-GMP phosphodiesterase